jgi:hypothetical protein
MQDFSGVFWAMMTVGGPIILAAILAYGGYQSFQRRRQRGLPVGARPASPAEAAHVAATDRRSTGTYALRLGIPLLLACAITAAVIALYTNT